MSGFQSLLLVALLVTVVAAVWDHRTGLIPNRLTYPLVILGTVAHLVFALATYSNIGVWFVVAETFAGAILGGLVPVLLWRKNAMGGGDVKLLIGLGALLGPGVGLQLQLYSFFAALLIAPLVLAHRGVLLATLKRSAQLLVRPFRRNQPEVTPLDPMSELRFGPAIFLATALVAFLEWH